MDYSFPKERRLLRRSDYDSVLTKPEKKSSDSCFVVLASRNESTVVSRLGIIVPKKILKKAINRNNIKRLVRECFRNTAYTKLNLDIVVIAKIGLQKFRDNGFIMKSLKNHLNRIYHEKNLD